MYGTQAMDLEDAFNQMFENDVKMYGTQADGDQSSHTEKFENDVKMYGIQATAPTIWTI